MKLKLELKGSEIELTMDEARQLWTELNDLFHKPVFTPLPVLPDNRERHPLNPFQPTWLPQGIAGNPQRVTQPLICGSRSNLT